MAKNGELSGVVSVDELPVQPRNRKGRGPVHEVASLEVGEAYVYATRHDGAAHAIIRSAAARFSPRQYRTQRLSKGQIAIVREPDREVKG